MKANLLIVDDETPIRDLLERHFRFLDYQITCASNGLEALKILAHERIDVMISDIKMPEMDGIDLLRVMRMQYPMIRKIMITGYVTLDNALACMRLGAETCIFKPLEDLSELENAVETSLTSLQQWQQKLRQLKNLETNADSDPQE